MLSAAVVISTLSVNQACELKLWTSVCLSLVWSFLFVVQYFCTKTYLTETRWNSLNPLSAMYDYCRFVGVCQL